MIKFAKRKFPNLSIDTMNDYKFFHGNFTITSLRVGLVAFVVTTICFILDPIMQFDKGFAIIGGIIVLYAFIESCCYVSNVSTGGKSIETDIIALFGLGAIMIIPLIIWIILGWVAQHWLWPLITHWLWFPESLPS